MHLIACSSCFRVSNVFVCQTNIPTSFASGETCWVQIMGEFLGGEPGRRKRAGMDVVHSPPNGVKHKGSSAAAGSQAKTNKHDPSNPFPDALCKATRSQGNF